MRKNIRKFTIKKEKMYLDSVENDGDVDGSDTENNVCDEKHI